MLQVWKEVVEMMSSCDVLTEKYNLLKGNFIGYLEGVLFWDVDKELVKRLEEKIKELKKL
jgi:hypothetical protein